MHEYATTLYSLNTLASLLQSFVQKDRDLLAVKGVFVA